MRLTEAGPDERERVLRATHHLRDSPLTPDDDVGFYRTLFASAWGRAHERLLVARGSSGRPEAAVRLGWLPGRLDGRPVRIARLGSLHILPEAKVDAEEILALALEAARSKGNEIVLALSAADGPDLARHDFRPLPCSEAACRTILPAPWPKEPAWMRAAGDPFASVPGLRRAGPDDLEAVAAIHASAGAAQRFAIERDRSAWEQILLARETLRTLRGADDPFWVIEKDGRVDAYLMLEAARPTVRWREHGARTEAEHLLPVLFWAALAWARGLGAQRIEGWSMPDVLTVLPLYPTSDRRRKTDIVMFGSFELQQPPAFTREEECRVRELDVLL